MERRARDCRQPRPSYRQPRCQLPLPLLLTLTPLLEQALRVSLGQHLVLRTRKTQAQNRDMVVAIIVVGLQSVHGYEHSEGAMSMLIYTCSECRKTLSLQFPSFWLSTCSCALRRSSLPPLFVMLDTNLGLPPLAPVALDLSRTDGLSTQTPIDMGIELVVVCEWPCTQRTLAHNGSSGRRRW
jgi:hypothetical protein